jgi:hypothetical protein
MRSTSVSKTSVKTLDSVSLDTVEPLVGMFPATDSEPLVGISPVAVAAVGAGLQVGISPANAETDRAHVTMSVASIRFIDVAPV